MAVEYLIWGTVSVLLLYFVLMLVVTSGWYRLKYFNHLSVIPQVSVSVVVAVRNEEVNIECLLQALLGQNYPADLFEIIVVDDHSEDSTWKKVQQVKKKNPQFSIALMHATGHGKKSALADAIVGANGELIVTTDGDCDMGVDWINTIASYYETYHPMMIIAPVVYHNEKDLFQRLFSLDFISLVASGAGSAGAGLPLMGNGANLAFTKQAWERANEMNKVDRFASGDDVFLIHRIAAIYGNKSVQFLKNTSTLVRTAPPTGLAAFFQQRIRWASKAKGYKSPWAIFVSVVVSLTNFLIAFTFFSGFFRVWFFVIYGLFVFLKLLFELPLLFEFTAFVNKRKLLVLSIPLALIYPLYIVFTATPALFFRFEWKGRKCLK